MSGETSETKPKILYYGSSSYLWGGDLYERIYSLLGHHYPGVEIYESRFRPDMLAASQLVVVVPTVDGRASRAVWHVIKAAKRLRKRIVLAALVEDTLNLTPLEMFSPKIDDTQDDHFVLFNKRPAPQPSSLRQLKDTAKVSRSLRIG